MGNLAGVRRDFDALEERRFEAMRLLGKGLNQSEVARRLKVARQSVVRWVQLYQSTGRDGLHKAGRAGRKPQLTGQDRQRLIKALKQGPEVLGMRHRYGLARGWRT